MESSRCLVAAAALALCALESPAAWAEGTPADRGTSIELRNDYGTRGKGGFVNATVLGAEYAFNKGVSLRVDVPMVYTGELGAERSLGLGDVLVKPNVRLVDTPHFALLLGSDLVLDSAASAALGSGKNRVAPFAKMFFGASSRLWLGLTLQQAVWFGGDPRREGVNYSVLLPFAILDLPAGFWLELDQRLQIDHRDAPNLASTTILEVGKVINDRVQVYVDPGVQVSRTGTVDWLMTGAVRWTFPSSDRTRVASRTAVPSAPRLPPR